MRGLPGGKHQRKFNYLVQEGKGGHLAMGTFGPVAKCLNTDTYVPWEREGDRAGIFFLVGGFCAWALGGVAEQMLLGPSLLEVCPPVCPRPSWPHAPSGESVCMKEYRYGPPAPPNLMEVLRTHTQLLRKHKTKRNIVRYLGTGVLCDLALCAHVDGFGGRGGT